MNIETILYWITISIYVFCSLFLLVKYIFKLKNNQFSKIVDIFIIIGFIVHSSVIIARWVISGHFPVMGDYENVLVGSWTVMIAYYLILYKWRNLKNLLIIILPFIVLMLGYGLGDELKAGPLTPPYQSPWLVVHIIFAWFAYAPFAISFALGIIFFLKEKKNDFEPGERDKIDRMISNLIIFGFINEAIMIITGSIWANLLWGHYWSWDPVEIWSLISWLFYGLYIHFRLTYKWKYKKAAWMAVISFIFVLLTFWGINLMGKGLHIFNLI